MTKDEMVEHIRTQATARVNRVIEGMFPGTGLTADIMGIDADFNKGLFDDVYLNLFSLSASWKRLLPPRSNTKTVFLNLTC